MHAPQSEIKVAKAALPYTNVVDDGREFPPCSWYSVKDPGTIRGLRAGAAIESLSELVNDLPRNTPLRLL